MWFSEPRTAENAFWGGIFSFSERIQALGMDFEGPGTVSHGLGVFFMVRCSFLFESFDFASFSLCLISLLGRGPNLDISIEVLDILLEPLIFCWNP